MSLKSSRIKGAREHNLRDINVDIPRDQLVVITGLSGSGKSTLAFDTIYAEGQRKYVESLSAYARQFLEQLQKPDLDEIEGLPPTIAIEQRSASSNPRSIVATTTEIYDYLRVLVARVETPLKLSQGLVIVTLQQDGKWVDTIYSEKFACPEHPHVSLGELEPRIFSFNSPHGACPECHGLGTVSEFDPEMVVPDEGISLENGAIEAWRKNG